MHCQHSKLFLDRASSTAATGKHKFNISTRKSTFPSPLTLPDDDLAIDPEYPPQPFSSWITSDDRNPVTPEQKVIYVAAPPGYATDAAFIKDWATPTIASDVQEEEPDTLQLMEYLRAFYYPLEVRPLPVELTFAPWDSNLKTTAKYIALNTPTDSTRIRTRPCPPTSSFTDERSKLFTRQLNLSDILDALLHSVLPILTLADTATPSDLYALLLLVPHDLYESPTDDFICGRAFGASRIAVVSYARYRPCLDQFMGVEGEDGHAWPACHCQAYVTKCIENNQGEQGPPRKKKKNPILKNDAQKTENADDVDQPSAVKNAIVAFAQFRKSSKSPSSLLFFRVTRTSSHELGHCFGMDHCVFHACNMQGSASIREDTRQPPYLCQVCIEKVGWSVHEPSAAVKDIPSKGGRGGPRKANKMRARAVKTASLDIQLQRDWEKQRYRKLIAFCETRQDCASWVAYQAWMTARLKELNLEVIET